MFENLFAQSGLSLAEDETLWATDFFSKKVWTMGGLVEFFVLFFITAPRGACTSPG